ncbi:hypothetical protein [Anabaena azotica]|uniref:Uncharacterized protein n=1 Tax=Anabaena azotica FACHB-119 TaxID=947527 RepID=A0ABR8DA96_9NOST|nr:hypothetical protein [Anabaena azotica]MBD2503061.1 hypothetical protein [Anabaena azotica FACHB-119]
MDSQAQQQQQTEVTNELVDSIENLYDNFLSEDGSLVNSVQEEQASTSNEPEQEQVNQETQEGSPVKAAEFGCVETPQGRICD